MVSRYWSFYPVEEPIGDASIFLESLTKNQLIGFLVIWILLYIMVSKYILPMIYLLASGYLTFQLYLHQTMILTWLKVKSS